MGQIFKKGKTEAPPAQGNGMNGAPPAPELGKSGKIACPQGNDTTVTNLKTVATSRITTGY